MSIAAAANELVQPSKMNYEIHGNTVPHLHLHLFPRFAGDPFEGRDTGRARHLRTGPPRTRHTTRMEGFVTPEDAARASMPTAITHVVQSRVTADGQSAWVLLAVEVAGTGHYLDENVCEREDDGSWSPTSSCGSGFTDRTLDDLRTEPPPQTLFS